MQEKNLAALLREDARTVHVVFEKYEVEFEDLSPTARAREMRKAREMSPTYGVPATKTWTYISHLPLKKGDAVIVDAKGEMKLAWVLKVDAEVEIEPGCDTQYKWIVSVVDIKAHEANMERNRQIEKVCADAYRGNLRRSFAQNFLSGVDSTMQKALTALIKGEEGLT